MFSGSDSLPDRLYDWVEDHTVLVILSFSLPIAIYWAVVGGFAEGYPGIEPFWAYVAIVPVLTGVVGLLAILPLSVLLFLALVVAAVVEEFRHSGA